MSTTNHSQPPGVSLISTLNPDHFPTWPWSLPGGTGQVAHIRNTAGSGCIIILDSSYNPPTRAHALLLRTALLNVPRQSPSAILLLLATTNADKGRLTHEDILHRLGLMNSLARSLHFPSHIPIGIATTSHALFASKAHAVSQFLTTRLLHSSSLSCASPCLYWLLGEDTVARLLHPKYYPRGSNILQVMLSFLVPTHSCILMAPRPELPLLNGAQLNLIAHLLHQGFLYHLNIGTSIDHFQRSHVSSSRVRQLLAVNDDHWCELVVPEVEEYIIKHRLYGYNIVE